MNNEWFQIIDIQKFLDATRIIVYSSFGNEETDTKSSKIISEFSDLSDEEQKEIDTCLSYGETENIAKEFIVKKKSKKTKKIVSHISEQSYQDLIEALYARMISNMLNKMASENILESAFDEEANDFVFWIKDNNIGDKKDE